jgi:hypothetical protein
VSELVLKALRAYLMEELLRLEAINLDRPRRTLRITPVERGSGRSDISDEHDQYLAEAIAERKLRR